MNNFDYLMERFLNDTATPEERVELFKLIGSGRYEGAVGDAFIARVKASQGKPFAEKAIANEVYAAMAAENKTMVSAGSRVVPMRPVFIWWKIAAAAMIMLSMGISVYVYRFSDHLTEAGSPAIANYEFKGKRFVNLPDGSTAILNEGSLLTYSSSTYGTDIREVTLSGEGYFDVKHDPTRTFIVRCGDVTTAVLGTAFNVKAYPGDKEVTVTVTRGKVAVGRNRKPYDVIIPNEQIAVNTTTYDFIKTSVSADDAVAWKSGFIILNNVTLEEAATRLEAKYNVKIKLASEALKHCKITSTFLNNESLPDLLTIITASVNANFTMTPGEVTITGPGCKASE